MESRYHDSQHTTYYGFSNGWWALIEDGGSFLFHCQCPHIPEGFMGVGVAENLLHGYLILDALKDMPPCPRLN